MKKTNNPYTIRKITENEINACNKLASISFELPYDEKAFLEKREKGLEIVVETNPDVVVHEDKIDIYPLKKWAAFSDDKDLAGVLSVLPYKTHFDGGIYDMVGVGSVCTFAQFRRQGAISKCMVASVKEMYEEGKTFAFLYAFSEGYYRKFGFEATYGKVRWKLDLNTIPQYEYPGTFTHFEGGDLSEVQDIYRKYAPQYNMMLERDSYDWRVFADYDPLKGNKHMYIYYDENQEASGYFLFRTEISGGTRNIQCEEIVYKDFDTLSAILNFVKVFKSDYRAIIFDAPRDMRLEYFCTDYTQSCSSREILQNGMVRVVNVIDVLKGAQYKGDGDFTLDITDEQIEENNGVFKVVFKGGKAEEVKRIDMDKPDIKMSIQVFSTAIIGGYNMEEMAFRRDVTVNNDKHLDKVFYNKMNFILNYF